MPLMDLTDWRDLLEDEQNNELLDKLLKLFCKVEDRGDWDVV